MPIHGGKHFTLVIICHPGLKDLSRLKDLKMLILHLDSLAGEGRSVEGFGDMVGFFLLVPPPHATYRCPRL